MRNGVRYANFQPYTPPNSLGFQNTGLTGNGTSSSSSSSSSSSGWSWNIVSDGISNVFGWLGGKQTVQLANVTSYRDIATDSNKTTRTTIIVLGLVALAIVGAIVIKSSKK